MRHIRMNMSCGSNAHILLIMTTDRISQFVHLKHILYRQQLKVKKKFILIEFAIGANKKKSLSKMQL